MKKLNGTTQKEALERVRANIGEASREKLRVRLGEVNNQLTEKAYHYDCADNRVYLTGYSYLAFYDWDLYFENIYQSYHGISDFCFTNLEKFLEVQEPNGFIARTFGCWGLTGGLFKPFIAQTALLGTYQTGNWNWLRERYGHIKKFLEYWFAFKDSDHNGLCYWDSALQSGCDNQDSRCTGLCEGVDLNCYLVRELQSMTVIAGHLGYAEDKKAFEEQVDRLISLINSNLWDKDTGFYYDRDEKTGLQIQVKAVSGFTPLWVGIASPEQARRLVYEHLLNPDEFWTDYPVATYARTEPDYYQGNKDVNWRGSNWIPTTYMVFHGLMKYGYYDIAGYLAYKTFEMVLQKDKNTREFYNAVTGEGYGMDPFYGWSTLAYYMPLEFELSYNPTNLLNKEIKPLGELYAIDPPVYPKMNRQNTDR